MTREESPKFHSEMITEKRTDRLASLMQAVTEGIYKVKAEDIAEKLLKEWLLELTLALYKNENRRHRNNESAA